MMQAKTGCKQNLKNSEKKFWHLNMQAKMVRSKSMPRKYSMSPAAIEARKAGGKARQESMTESERAEFASDGAATRWHLRAKRRKRKPRAKAA